jgi:hypothetical protein
MLDAGLRRHDDILAFSELAQVLQPGLRERQT